MEKKWLSYYKNVPMITVSNSTKIELEKLGCKRVKVIQQGLSTESLPKLPEKETDPTMVFIGRLKKHKRPQDAILAFLLIKKQIPDAKLWIIGDGYMRSGLEKKFNHEDISFLGYVNTQTKNRLISRAHLVLLPATREGWPLVVLESNSMGTPVLGYDVPGVRDPIRDGETSILVKDTTPEGLAASAVLVLRDHDLLRKLSSNALSFSKQFNWDISADAFDRVIAEEISRMSND